MIRNIVRNFANNKIVLIFLISLILITINSMNSPLYEFNNWSDVNLYFNIGKGLFKGDVLYRDLIDHKGPYIFFIYGIASLMSEFSLIGVYFFEIVACALFLFYVIKIIELYSTKYAMIGAIIICVSIYTNQMFCNGGSVEEFMLPLYAYGILSVLKVIRNEYKNIRCLAIMNGISIGIILLTKYTLLGIYIGIFLCLILKFSIEKKYQIIMQVIIYGLIGVIISVFPWLIYAVLTNSVNELWTWYFYNNIFGMVGSMPIYWKILKCSYSFFQSFNGGNLYFIVFLISFFYVIKNACNKKSLFRFESLTILILFITTCTFIYFGWSAHIYYGIPISAIVIPGFSMFLRNIDEKNILTNVNWVNNNILVLCIFVLFNLVFSKNIVKTFKEDTYVEQQIADIVNQYEGDTMLVYGPYDTGFYLLSNINPTVPFSFRINLYTDYVLEEQKQYIIDNEINFVVTNQEHQFIVESGYKLIYTSNEYFLYYSE